MPQENNIMAILKKWFTGGAISVQGVYISRDQCASALYMLDRYIAEDSADSWKETCEEIKRISNWQIGLLVNALRSAAFDVHMTSIATEDQSNFKEEFRHSLEFKDCKQPKCEVAKEALTEVGASIERNGP